MAEIPAAFCQTEDPEDAGGGGSPFPRERLFCDFFWPFGMVLTEPSDGMSVTELGGVIFDLGKMEVTGGGGAFRGIWTQFLQKGTKSNSGTQNGVNQSRSTIRNLLKIVLT